MDQSSSFNKILVIVGPTATGKTDLGLKLAKKFEGEIIACDSRQIYQDLNIVTGKLPTREVTVVKSKGYWLVDGIKIWLYDQVLLSDQYSAADYQKDSHLIIEDIHHRGKLPIVVGGTGFYLQTLLQPEQLVAAPANQTLRQKLEQLSLEKIQQKIKKLSITNWNLLNNSERHNKRRLIRHIEILLSKKGNQPKIRFLNSDILKIGLIAPTDILDLKINQRVEEWVSGGLVAEVQQLVSRGISLERLENLGLAYGIMARFLKSEIDLIESVKRMQQVTRQYARRQLTWFKKDPEIKWFDITLLDTESKIEKLTQSWYDAGKQE